MAVYFPGLALHQCIITALIAQTVPRQQSLFDVRGYILFILTILQDILNPAFFTCISNRQKPGTASTQVQRPDHNVYTNDELRKTAIPPHLSTFTRKTYV